MFSDRRVLAQGAGSALFYLVGLLLVGIVIGFTLNELGVHNIEVIGFSILFALCIAAGALWGRALARISGYPDSRSLILASSVSYGPGVIIVGYVLGVLEKLFVEQGQSSLPIYVLFAILFTPAMFVIAGLNGLANGIALKSVRASLRLALGGGAAGALGFLVPTLILDLLGRRVGGPDAAASATMVTTLLIGMIFGAASAGALIAALLKQTVAQVQSSPEQVAALAD